MPAKKPDASWLEFAGKVFTLGRDIFEQASFTESKRGAKDPRVIAMALLARTMNAFEGAILLRGHGHIVEARNLVRSCYENAFYIEALVSRGDAFVDDMVAHHVASRKKRSKSILEWSAGERLDPVIAQKLQAHLKKQKQIAPKGKILHLNDFALTGVLADAYHIYAQLCEDAAHANINSISRHVQIKRSPNESDITVCAIAKLRPNEGLETLDFACGALMAVCVGVNQILGGTPAGASMEGLWQEYKTLQKSIRTSRLKP